MFVALEDAEDYKAFEAGIIVDYDAQSAVERELVLRLATILWRLRRATTMETGLLRDYRQNCRVAPKSRDIIHALFRPRDSTSLYRVSHSAMSKIETVSDFALKADASVIEFARCFLRLADLPNFALDRLSRYEATLWRRAAGRFTLSKHWIVANRRSERAVSDEKVRSFQGKISKNDTQIEQPRKWNRAGGSSLHFNRFMNV